MFGPPLGLRLSLNMLTIHNQKLLTTATYTHKLNVIVNTMCKENENSMKIINASATRWQTKTTFILIHRHLFCILSGFCRTILIGLYFLFVPRYLVSQIECTIHIHLRVHCPLILLNIRCVLVSFSLSLYVLFKKNPMRKTGKVDWMWTRTQWLMLLYILAPLRHNPSHRKWAYKTKHTLSTIHSHNEKLQKWKWAEENSTNQQRENERGRDMRKKRKKRENISAF